MWYLPMQWCNLWIVCVVSILPVIYLWIVCVVLTLPVMQPVDCVCGINLASDLPVDCVVWTPWCEPGLWFTCGLCGMDSMMWTLPVIYLWIVWYGLHDVNLACDLPVDCVVWTPWCEPGLWSFSLPPTYPIKQKHCIKKHWAYKKIKYMLYVYVYVEPCINFFKYTFHALKYAN